MNYKRTILGVSIFFGVFIMFFNAVLRVLRNTGISSLEETPGREKLKKELRGKLRKELVPSAARRLKQRLKKLEREDKVWEWWLEKKPGKGDLKIVADHHFRRDFMIKSLSLDGFITL